jgi:hypothetical protein
MGKGANKQLLSNSGKGQYHSDQLSGKADAITDFATPVLEGDVNNPKGYSPQQLAYMNTASQQSLGGSTAGITGEANLEAARTRNAGGFQGVAGSAARASQRQLSQNAVGIQKSQADVQLQQRDQAIKSLMSLYGIDENTALGYLGASTTALHDENQSHPNQEGLLTAGTFIKDLASGASSAASAANGGGRLLDRRRGLWRVGRSAHHRRSPLAEYRIHEVTHRQSGDGDVSRHRPRGGVVCEAQFPAPQSFQAAVR